MYNHHPPCNIKYCDENFILCILCHFYIHGYIQRSVTNIPGSGPFVNSDGELDLSDADPEDSGIYTCFGVDAAGKSASQRFNVQVVGDGEY